MSSVDEKKGNEVTDDRGIYRRRNLQKIIEIYAIATVIGLIFGGGFYFIEWPFQKIKLSDSMIDLISDFPFVLLALFMGAIGGGIKYVTLSKGKKKEPESENIEHLSLYNFLFIGSSLGVFSFLFVKSRIVGTLFYSDGVVQNQPISAHGIALFSAAAGYFSFELLGYAKDRLKQITGK